MNKLKIQSVDPAVNSQPLKRREEGRDVDIALREKMPNGEEKGNGALDRDDLSREAIEKAIEQANNTMRTYNRSLAFELHEASGEWRVSVINKDTDEVIREIPPEWVLDMVAHFRDMVGVMVDEIV